MANGFAGKVAVVTGAASGIGRALAQALAQRGARLALADINQAGLDETSSLLTQDAEVCCYRTDVTCQAAVEQLAADVERDFGAAHFLFNNAGATIFGTWANLDLDEIRWQIDVNLWSVIYSCKVFLPIMLAAREGCIVNVSSVFGLIGFVAQGPYCVSKFGVRGLTETLWSELEGTGVRAVSVHPGGIRTGIDRAARVCARGGATEQWAVSKTPELLITPPQDCAEQILKGIERGRRRIVTGHNSGLINLLSRLFPNSYPHLLRLAGFLP